MASLSLSPEQRSAIDAFRRDVLEASLKAPVLVRFTAEWCGPCKQLAPLLDKVVADHGKGRIAHVAIDIDHNRLIAEQFRIQSVPTVYAFLGGQPVDGFVGVKSERELKAFIEKLLAQAPQTDEEAGIEDRVAAAEAVLAAGEAQQAAELFAALARELPDHAEIAGGYARALLAEGLTDGAEAALAPFAASTDPAVIKARAALDLQKSAVPAGDMQMLMQRITTDPADHGARIDLATALIAAGDRDGAADQLLAAIAADRTWNDGAARAQLLKLIEAVGLADPWAVAVRRRLSGILFS